ncbi:MAG: NUDIX domain-containing protein [Balneolaceae bacterium]|nr:NUDIX domain-containing protein [Balneolaceae bacterium]
MELIPVTAAGGVLYQIKNDRTLVLLILRRGKWDIPKGKIEGEESLLECARREVSEEVGIPLPDISDKLIKTYHEYEEEGKYIGKTTHWYAMQTPVSEEFSPEKEEDISDVAWVPLSEAKEKVGYENLRTVLQAFEDWIREKAS